MFPRVDSRQRMFVLAATVLFVAPAVVRAQAPELQKLLPGGLSNYDHMGAAVALEGDVAVLGAPEKDVVGYDEGGAWVYRYDGSLWQEEQLLTGNDSANYDDYGFAVALSGNFLAIGAPLHDELGTDSGAVYVYKYAGGSWSLNRKLTASDGNAGDRFGFALAMHGDTLVVGAPGDDITTTDVGSVYVFEYQGTFVGWTESQKLTAPVTAAYDQFGYSLDMDDQRIAVGSPYRDTAYYDAGAVLLFVASGGSWVYETELTSASANYYDSLGWDVAVDGSMLVVGVPYDDDMGSQTGCVLVFHEAGGVWSEQTTLFSPAPTANEYYGARVDVQDRVLVVGVQNADVDGYDSGAVYSYLQRGPVWYYDQPLGSSAGAASDYFGSAVALDDFRLLTGAMYDDDATYDGGAGFIHSVGRFVLDAEPNQVSEGDTLTFTSYNGTPGTKCWFAVLSIGGTPYFQVLFSLKFAADHRMSFSFDTPPGLSGIQVGFETFKIAPWGKVQGSNLEYVDFL